MALLTWFVIEFIAANTLPLWLIMEWLLNDLHHLFRLRFGIWRTLMFILRFNIDTLEQLRFFELISELLTLLFHFIPVQNWLFELGWTFIRWGLLLLLQKFAQIASSAQVAGSLVTLGKCRIVRLLFEVCYVIIESLILFLILTIQIIFFFLQIFIMPVSFAGWGLISAPSYGLPLRGCKFSSLI